MDSGQAPNYAFIFDRSPTGLDAIAYLKTVAPGDIKARLTAPAFHLWDATGFEFVVIWGSWGATGGLTVPTRDIDSLVHDTLPAVIKRNNEVGGLCVIAPAVAPEYRGRIEQKVAELQPTQGPAQ